MERFADRWELVVVNRRGFLPNPPAARSDFDFDADQLAALLDDGEPAHVVGHSYGGLIALLAAARRPHRVRSLTLIEPAVFDLVRGDPDVEASIEAHLAMVAAHRNDPRAFLSAFVSSLGGDPGSVPEPLPPAQEQHVRLLINERPPWEAKVPVDELATASFPKLVVSGAHSQIQELMCDALTAAMTPRSSRALIAGAGHSVQRRADEFNRLLEEFLTKPRA